MHGAIYKERGLLTEGEKRLRTKKKLSNCWKQSGNHLRWLFATAEATKGAQTTSAERTTWLTRQQREQQKNYGSLECRSKLENFCWLQSYPPFQITPRRKNDEQKMKKRLKKRGAGGSCLTNYSLSPVL
jgi:hypothetical protein